MRPTFFRCAIAALLLTSCAESTNVSAPPSERSTVPGSVAGALAPTPGAGDQIVFQDNFDSYTATTGFKGAYAKAGAVSLVTGRSGAGKSARFSYSAGSSYNLLERMIPAASDLYVSYWYRTSPGADPTNKGSNRWGMTMLRAERPSEGRWEVNVAQSSLLFGIDDSATPMVYQNLSTTPRFGTTNDGAWHQFMARLVGGPAGYAKVWIDGTLVTDTKSLGYKHSSIGVNMVRFPGELAASPWTPFTIDIDDLHIWRPGTGTPPSDTTPPPTVPAPVARVLVSPASVSLNQGGTTQLNLTLQDSAGNGLSGRVTTWSTSNAALVMVTSSGSVRAMAEGTVTITATSEGKSGSAQVTVAPIPVASVSVTLNSASLTPGNTTQAVATLRDAVGNALAGRTVAWESSDPGVATVSTSGVVTAVSAGSANITASAEGLSGSASLTVAPPAPAPVATVSVSLAASSRIVGQNTQATATMRDASGNTLSGRAVAWSSSNTAVATVDAAGLVTAVAVGSANITATSEGRTGSAAFTVTAPPPAPVATVAVSLAASSRTVGQTTQATATLRDGSGNTLTGRTVTWSSSNTSVATVSGSGLVTAVGAGTANITATSEGQSGSAGFTATAPAPAPVASATVTPSSASIDINGTVQLSVTLRDAAGNTLTGRAVTWSSSNPFVASVSSSGLVRGVAGGAATITATSEGRSGTSSVTVNAPPPPPPTGSGEPVYNPSTQLLIVQDNFDQYATIGAALNAYPNNRGTADMELTTGRGGAGKAARLKYGTGAAYDIVYGPEGRLDRVGGWNGTLPQKAGPYTHFYFTTWFRFSAGANPAANNGSGIKGFMFWTGSGRYQNAINQISADGMTRGPKGANPNNAQSGQNLYKTADGRAPLFSTIADGQWHRFTIEIYAGNDPSGHRGERYWIDGNLVYSDLDLQVGSGTAAGHYDYLQPITHWMVFGNFVSEGARSPFFTFDVDDWTAWTQ